MSGPRYKNISGKKFNKLTAIKPTFKKRYKRFYDLGMFV